MTTGSNTSGTNELMQEGIRHVREARMADAYRTFREVVTRDPNNEYAWIWISQTSSDREERRFAIDRAFEINPSSQHARQALERLQQEEDTQPVPVKSVPAATLRASSIEKDAGAPSGGLVRLEEAAGPDELAELRQASAGEKEGRFGKSKKTRDRDKKESAPVIKGPPKSSSQKTKPFSVKAKKRHGFRNAFLFLVFLVIAVGGVFFYLANKQQISVALFGREQANTSTQSSPSATGITSAVSTAAVSPSTAVITAVPSAASNSANVTPPGPFGVSPTPRDSGVGLSNTPTSVAGSSTPRPAATAPAATTSTVLIAPTAANTVIAATPAAIPTFPSGTNSNPNAVVNPVGPTEILNAAQNLIISGDYKSAIAVLKEAVKTNPKNVTVNYRLGSAYLAAPANQLSGITRFDEAIESFKQVVTLAPNWPAGYSRLGEAYSAKGDVARAIAAYSKSLELDPSGPERWLALAALYDKNNQPAEAAYSRSRAQGLNPTPTAAPPGAGSTPTVKR